MPGNLRPGSPLPKGMRWRGDRIEAAAFLRKGRGGRPTRTFAADELAEAKDWIADTVRNHGRHRRQHDRHVTVGEYAKHWLRTRRGMAPSTAKGRWGLVECHIEPSWLSGMAMIDVRPQHIDAWVTGLRSTKTGDPLGGNTVRRVLAVVHLAFEHAIRNGVIPAGVNPAAGCETLPPLPAPRHTTISRADFDGRLLPAVRADYQLLVRFLAYSGLRWGEATGLRVADVLPLTSAVRVAEQLSALRDEDGQRMRGPTKSRLVREQPLMPELFAQVQAHTRGRDLGDLLFVSPTGLPLQGAWFARCVLRPALRRAGLDERMRLHDLRHCCATWLFAEGFSTMEVAQYLGHSSDVVTRRVYIGIAPERSQLMAERLFAPRESGS